MIKFLLQVVFAFALCMGDTFLFTWANYNVAHEHWTPAMRVAWVWSEFICSATGIVFGRWLASSFEDEDDVPPPKRQRPSWLDH